MWSLSARTWRRCRTIVYARDGRRCYRCGGYADTVDHIIPIALGGAPYDPANLRPACRHCNCSTGGRLGAQRQQRQHRYQRRRVWPGAVEV